MPKYCQKQDRGCTRGKMHELRYIEIRKFLDSKNTPALEPALNLEKKKKPESLLP